MKNKRRKRKNCPECIYWWFNERTYGCSKNPERPTYTSFTLPSKASEREWCIDMKKRKQ